LEIILTASNLSKNFGPLKAVNNLSFELYKGNVYGILGPNGSGKSTTLGMVLNVVNPSLGHFEWFEGSSSVHQALKKVGAIIERPNFYPYLTAVKNLELVSKIKEVSTDKIEEKLKLVGLWDRRESKFSTYSLGMKQRLAIASALLNDPEILILDEPTNGLDPEGIHQIRSLIIEIASRGTTILLASHLLDEVEKVCTHVLVLQKGNLLYDGKVSEMNGHKGFFKLKSQDHKELIKELETIEALTAIVEKNGFVIADLKSNIDSEVLNKQLADKGIYLSHLTKEYISLEEQFLSLTKSQYQR
jgi:ABC-2 type transport system ATP-binding protein